MESEIDKLYYFQECEGFRKGSRLLYIPETQQLYSSKSNTRGTKRYVCYTKGCTKSVVVDFANSNICRIPIGRRDDVHNHPTQEIIYENMKLANAIKNRCANSTLQKNEIRKIFNEECSKNETEAIGLQFGRMQRQLINIRNSALAIPKNTTGVYDIFKNQNVMDVYGMSRYKKNDKFYQCTIIENQFSYTVFMSPTIAEGIKKQSNSKPKEYAINATFSPLLACGYKQLLIIHYCYEGQVYPLFYILMSSKDEECYRHVFEFIDSNLFKLEAGSFVTDFERALRNSLKKVFPSATLNTSWFHFCREVRRRAKEIPEFKNMINSNPLAKLIFKKLLALPLLKPTDMVSGFELLKIEANLLAKSSQFDELFGYFQNQWMQKKTPIVWSEHKNAIRTTSALETFNRQLSQQLAKCKNFFKLIDTILKQDLAKSKDFEMLLDVTLDDLQPPKKRLKDTSFLIEDMTDKLNKNKITINDFLTQLTNSKLIKNSSSFDDKDNEIKDEINYEINDDDKVTEDETKDETEVKVKEEIIDDIDADNCNTGNSNNEDKANIQEPILICTECCKNPRTILVQPCNHFKLCSTCFEQIAEKYTRYDKPILCPICRQVVQNSTTIFP